MSGKLHKTEALFDKVENTTLQKLEALESASLLLDERLFLKDDTRQSGLSLAIGQKGSGAKRFYSKVSTIHLFNASPSKTQASRDHFFFVSSLS